MKRLFRNIAFLFLSDKQKERIYIEELRREFVFFGHDISDMTDEEVKQGVQNVADSIGRFGFTMEEAAHATKTLAEVGNLHP